MLTPTCNCKQTTHNHGDYVMYVIHKCRCDTCREATVEHARQRRRAQLYGRYYLTDAEPARWHVRYLMSVGMGWKRVAETAGVATSTLYPLLYGRGGKDPRPPRKQISKTLEAKLLAVIPAPTTHSIIDNTGSIRRLRALVSKGWSQKRLAESLDVQPSNFGKIIHGEHAGIRASTAERIEELFEANWDREPVVATRFEQAGVTRAKKEAKAKGWVTAAAWDNIDDPGEAPKADVVDESISYRSLPALEKIDRLELLLQDGYGDTDDTFVRAGWASRASAWKVLQRMNRLDLVDRLQRNDNVRQVAS